MGLIIIVEVGGVSRGVEPGAEDTSCNVNIDVIINVNNVIIVVNDVINVNFTIIIISY